MKLSTSLLIRGLRRAHTGLSACRRALLANTLRQQRAQRGARVTRSIWSD